MKNAKRFIWFIITLVSLGMLVAACARQLETVEVTRVVTDVVVETVEVEGEPIEVTRIVEGDIAATAVGTAVAQIAPQQRLIIKNGQLTVLVDDTDQAVDQATQLTVELGGYIISQLVYDDDEGYRFAALRLAVPVTRFEEALRDLRMLGQVSNEAASGEDVTDEFVDLNSRLDNLIATRDRLRSFLDAAQTVEEALEINQELKVVEEEIAVIQGRINYLRDRAAFSTIDLTINPFVPTPTPTPTPTATPIPTAEAWHPLNTAKVAAVDLQETAQETADFSIYYGIVCGPWLAFMGLIAYAGWRLRRRLQRRGRFNRQMSDI